MKIDRKWWGTMFIIQSWFVGGFIKTESYYWATFSAFFVVMAIANIVLMSKCPELENHDNGQT